MKRLTLVLLTLGMFSAVTVHAQTYKPDFSTKLVIPSGGSDPTNVFTITAGTLTGAVNWILPTTAGTSGYVLTMGASNQLTWTNPATGISLGGDVTGSAGSNTIASTAGPDIVAALNGSATSKSVNADALNYDATLQVTSHVLGINLSNANTWAAAQTISASGTGLAVTHNATVGGTLGVTGLSTLGGISNSSGLTSTGATNLNTTDATAVNIGTGSGNANAIGIGNGSSTTTMGGAVTFNGTVSLPAGSVTASSIGLATGDILIGDINGHAAAQSAHGDVTIGTDGTTTIGAGKVTNTDLANASLTVTGGTGLSGGGSVALGSSTTLTLDVTHGNTWTGDQSLPADATQGNNLVAALNDATASSLNADPIKHDATLKVASNQIGVDLTHANTWSGTQTLGGVAMTSTSPTALSGNTENWALSTSNSYFFISASGAVNLTGITGGADGRAIVLVNNGTSAITLVNDDGSGSDNGSNSAPANRFNLPGGNLIMAQNGTVTLVYDGTSTNHRWRAVAIQ